ncbi:GNAT family N-acetyltransferase [Actinomadura alba]|uniref:GNAT family N-acetyltransferase n=1 Tax=Actinomadura alba TaxID=406431 RepID=A0ABR7LXP3_9ACTN|nr:GNAT family N-acetyltransferase [Actinomadura alba]MBC6469624.1 GNAT family N-acetyltransferase [Actinomadura alba]
MTIQFRRARRDDVPAIVGLLADDTIGAGRESIGAGGDVDEAYWAAFDAVDADPNQLLVVAEGEGEVAGTMQLSFIPGLSRGGAWRAQIEAVRVSSSRRGGGLGGAMIDYAVGEARRRGCALVQLTTDRRRTGAHNFYERLGFESTHVGMKLVLGPDGS